MFTYLFVLLSRYNLLSLMQVVNEKGFVLLLHDECFLNTYEYSTSMEPERNRDPEAFSLYGEPLFRSPLRPERKEQQEEEYRDALEEYRKDPTKIENIIMLGRRTAYLGHHREANGIYSYGIAIHPK